MVKITPLSFTTGSFWPVMTREAVDLLLSAGIQDIELTLQMFEYFLNGKGELVAPVIPYIQGLVNQGKLRVRSIHTPHLFVEFNFSDRLRLKLMDHFLETARSLRAGVIVVHPFHLLHRYGTTLEYIEGKTSAHGALLPGIDQFLDRCHSTGVTLGMENIGMWPDPEDVLFNDPQFLKDFLEAVDHPALGLTLDIQHAIYHGRLEGFFELLSQRVVNIHAADVTCDLQRVPPGEGTLNWAQLMKQIMGMENLQALTVEIYTATGDSAKRACDFLENLSHI
jgi:sugar phosphate isomerase/epimerase